MKKFKKIAAAAASLAVMAATTMSLSGSAVTVVRDANGDGTLTLMDAVYTQQYLMGYYNPTSVKSFDYDGNGIISNMDIKKIMSCCGGGLSYVGLPKGVGADSQATTTTRTYMRHDCSNSNLASYSEYTLTVDPLDNSPSNANISPYSYPGIIGDNEMEKDSDTAVVSLSVSKTPTSNITGNGTGFIVNNHIIATAAHCIYDYKNNTFYDKYSIKLTDSNNNTKYVSAKYVDICKDFSNCGTKYNNNHVKYDYALIYVDENLSQYGAFQMGAALDQYAVEHGDVTVSGFPAPYYYPSEYEDDLDDLRLMSNGKLIHSNSKVLYYDADTGQGQSGGPVYAIEECTINNVQYKYKTVIAINVAIYEDALENAGVRITPDILKFYNDNPNTKH